MTTPTPRELAARAIGERSILEEADALHRETRTALADAMQPVMWLPMSESHASLAEPSQPTPCGPVTMP